MEKDIIERLRDANMGWSGDALCVDADTAADGAAEIERLREENDRFRKALEIIAGSSDKLQATQALGALTNIGAAVR